MEQMTQATNCSTRRNLMAVQMLRTLGFDQISINRALPKLTGLTQPELAKRFGVSRSAVAATIYMERTNAKLQEMISEAYNLPVGEMFPERQ